MFVCVCIRICVFVRLLCVCLYVYFCVYEYVCICLYVLLYVYFCLMCVCLYVCVFVYECIYVYMRVYVCIVSLRVSRFFGLLHLGTCLKRHSTKIPLRFWEVDFKTSDNFTFEWKVTSAIIFLNSNLIEPIIKQWYIFDTVMAGYLDNVCQRQNLAKYTNDRII